MALKKHECSDDCYYYRNNIKHPRSLTDAQKQIVRDQLRGKGGDWYETSRIVENLAVRFSVSKSTIYKVSRSVRAKKRRR